MIFKLGLLIICLFATICVATEDTQPENNKPEEPFSVEKVWRKTAPCTCTCVPDWVKPVQEYYDAAIAAFSSFPDQVAQPADVVKSTFQAILTKVIEFSNSESRILSSGATAILESFAKVKLEIRTASGILAEFKRVLPILMSAYRDVVTSLTPELGCELVNAVNTAISELECEFKAYVEKFEEGDGHGRKVEIDYKPVMDKVQILTDTIALKNVKLPECKLEDPKVKEALVVLSFVLDYVMVLVHGVSSSSEAIIVEQKCEPTVILHVIVVSVGVFVKDVTESLFVNIVPNALNVPAHLANLDKAASKLSATLKALFKIVGKTLNVVTKTVTNTVQGLLKPLKLLG